MLVEGIIVDDIKGIRVHIAGTLRSVAVFIEGIEMNVYRR